MQYYNYVTKQTNLLFAFFAKLLFALLQYCYLPLWHTNKKNIMARTLTTIEAKELKTWAKHNSIILPTLSFGNGFWQGEDITTLKAALLELEDESQLRLAARKAVGHDFIAYDTVATLGNKNTATLIGYEGREVWVNNSSMIYVNGFLAIPKQLLS